MLSYLEYINLEITRVISESKLSGSGAQAERHTGKYIRGEEAKDPTSRHIKGLIDKAKSAKPENVSFEDVKTSPLTLNTDHEDISSGSYLIPHHTPKTKEIGGKYHSNFHVYNSDGEYQGIRTIPHTSVNKATNLTGRYNYEHALTRLYNHLSKKRDMFVDGNGNSRRPTLEEIQKEVEKGKNNKNHPLHMSKADPTHFAGGLAEEGSADFEKSRESHNDALDEVSTTINDLINNPSFRKNWKERHVIVNSGQSAAKASKLAFKVHGKQPTAMSLTAKADTFTFKAPDTGKDVERGLHKGTKITARNPIQTRGSKRISLKKASAQIHSGGGADSEIILRAAANEYFGKDMHDTQYNNKVRDAKGKEIEGLVSDKQTNDLLKKGFPDKKEQFDHVSNLISHFRHHMDNGNFATAQRVFNHLHESLPADVNSKGEKVKHSFLRLVYKHALTGEGKFDGHVGTATHVGETGKRGSIHSIEEYLDMADNSGQLDPTHPNGKLAAGRFRGSKHKGAGSTLTLPTFNSKKFEQQKPVEEPVEQPKQSRMSRISKKVVKIVNVPRKRRVA